MEGLMTDFPTAKELERFVYDQTGRVLNLKGRANKLKYQVAMDVLNGLPVDPAFVVGQSRLPFRVVLAVLNFFVNPQPVDRVATFHSPTRREGVNPRSVLHC
jgi:hypothetical protein